MLAAFQAGRQRQGDSDPNIKASAFGRNFRRRISEAHTPAYKTITLPGVPNTKHGPEWNPCASPEGEGLSAGLCKAVGAHDEASKKAKNQGESNQKEPSLISVLSSGPTLASN